jgi:hypothetical protein
MQNEIRAVVERELADLFGGEKIAASFARKDDVGRLEAGSFVVKPGENSQAIGVRLAQSIFQGIVQ